MNNKIKILKMLDKGGGNAKNTRSSVKTRTGIVVKYITSISFRYLSKIIRLFSLFLCHNRLRNSPLQLYLTLVHPDGNL